VHFSSTHTKCSANLVLLLRIVPPDATPTLVVWLPARIAGRLSSRYVAMIMYCWHALKLEGVLRAVD
jgi:hypothetical protein